MTCFFSVTFASRLLNSGDHRCRPFCPPVRASVFIAQRIQHSQCSPVCIEFCQLTFSNLLSRRGFSFPAARRFASNLGNSRSCTFGDVFRWHVKILGLSESGPLVGVGAARSPQMEAYKTKGLKQQPWRLAWGGGKRERGGKLQVGCARGGDSVVDRAASLIRCCYRTL